MYFDTHAHYDDGKFAEDREELFEYFKKRKDWRIINPGCDVQSSRSAIDFAERYEFIYAAVGIHPENIPEDVEASLSEIERMSVFPKCVAIGEIGLDYYWDSSMKDTQKLIFRKQMELAERTGKPVIIHDREAHADSMEIVNMFPAVKGVFHCFSGSAEMAQILLKKGWYLGFDGPITYKNARKNIEVLNVCPLERILIETDSPYLSPIPVRGSRNDSRNLLYIAEKIAEVKDVELDEVLRQTADNAACLFGLNN